MAVEPGKKLLIVCASCWTVNRVPAERLGEDPKCGKCGQPLLQGKPVSLDEAGFERLVGRTQLPVVVDFWAEWCGPCHAMAPVFERVAAELKGRVQFGKVDTEKAQSLASRFGIRSIPTLILFRAGAEAARVSGALDYRTLVNWLNQHAVA